MEKVPADETMILVAIGQMVGGVVLGGLKNSYGTY